MINGPFRRIPRGLLALLLAVSWAALHAQDWVVYDMTNSPLPSTTVNAVVEDPLGGVWIGTDWGLCHFDGASQWEVFQVANSGIVGNNVRSLAIDAQGRIWVGTVADGLSMFDGLSWTNYTTENSSLPESGVRDLFVDHRDWVWLTTAEGAVCITDEEWRIYDGTAQSYGGAVLNTGNTNAIAVRSDGLVCMGTLNGGLHFINGNEVTFLTTTGTGFFDNTATDVLFDPSTGDRWVTTPAAGLLRQQGPTPDGVWSQWNSSVGFPSNGLNCLVLDAAHTVWAGSQAVGLIRLDTDGDVTHFTMGNSGLPDDQIRSVMAGSDGSVWVGTIYGGLAVYRPNVAIGELEQGVIALYPNPVIDRCVVEVPYGGADWKWVLCDLQGRPVRNGRANGARAELALDGLSAGTYFLDIWGGSGHDRVKLIAE